MVEKRQKIEQRERESLLGYHLKEFSNHYNGKMDNKPIEIELSKKEK